MCLVIVGCLNFNHTIISFEPKHQVSESNYFYQMNIFNFKVIMTNVVEWQSVTWTTE